MSHWQKRVLMNGDEVVIETDHDEMTVTVDDYTWEINASTTGLELLELIDNDTIGTAGEVNQFLDGNTI